MMKPRVVAAQVPEYLASNQLPGTTPHSQAPSLHRVGRSCLNNHSGKNQIISAPIDVGEAQMYPSTFSARVNAFIRRSLFQSWERSGRKATVYQREILRRETFSVSMPKLNCLVGTEYDLNQIMGMHVLYVQKALGLNPLYWTLQDALWLLRKLPKPIRTSETQPPLPMSSDANVDRTSKVPESRLRT